MLDLARDLKRRARGLTADPKQKISLGRGLVRADVAAILFDEPLTVIDPHMKWVLRSQAEAAARRSSAITMIYVTHDQTEALTFADKVVVMYEGEVVQIGTPEELFERPAHTFVGYFIGSPGMNVLPATLDGATARVDGHAIPLARAYRQPDTASASRSACGPSMSRSSAGGDGLPVSVQRVDDLGRLQDRDRAARRAAAQRGDAGGCHASTARRRALRSRPRPRPRLCRRPSGRVDGGLADGQDRSTSAPGSWSCRCWRSWPSRALIPLMTVVNYSVQDTFGNNQFFWNGLDWFQELLDPSSELGGRFFDALARNLFFSLIILAIEIPLGIVVALAMPRQGWARRRLPGLMALPLLIPWNVVGTIWQIFARGDIGLLGAALDPPGHRLQLLRRSDRRLGHHRRHGRLALDLAGGAALLCRAASRSPTPIYQAARIDGASRWAVFRYIQLPKMRRRAADRRAAALHGQLHDLHRALRRHRRRARQLHDVPVDRPRQDGARPVRPRQGGGHVDRLLPDHPGRSAGSSTP